MPAAAYASLIRALRPLEEELYPHELDLIRAAADAWLLGDEDAAARAAEVDELLAWLAECDRLPAEALDELHTRLVALATATRRAAVQAQARAPRTGGLRDLIRSFLGLPGDGAPLPPPVAAPLVHEPAPPAPPGVSAEESARLLEQAERLLAFHAWLDANERR